MKLFRKNLRSEAGFTLVELLVVIAVLGILATIAVPRLTGVKDKAITAEALSGLDAFKTALEMYYVENDKYPGNKNDFNTMASEYIEGYNGNGEADGSWEEWTVAYGSNETNEIIAGDVTDETFVVKLSKEDGKYSAALWHTKKGYSTEETTK